MIESIGQRLKRARESRNLTVHQATEATRIRVQFLEALEADNYAVMTSAAQARGFLRNYADFLGLDLDAALAELQRSAPAAEEDLGPVSEPAEAATPVVEKGAPADSVPGLLQRLGGKVAAFRRRDKEPSPELTGPLEVARERPDEAVLPGADSNAAESILSPRPVAGATPDEVPIVAPAVTLDDIMRPPARSASAPEEGKGGAGEAGGPQEPTNAPITGAGFFGKIGRGVLQGMRSVGSLFRLRFRQAASYERRPPEVEPGPTSGGESQALHRSTIVEKPEAIMEEIGVQLRHRRELLGTALDEIEKHIHVKTALLEALEAGQLEQLPSPVQTRGMLANYATFLDLDVDKILLRFADVLQARHRQRYPERPYSGTPNSQRASLPPLRAFIAPDLLFGVGAVAVLLALAVWTAGRLLAPPVAEPELQFTAPSISEVLAATDQPGPGAAGTLISAAETASARETPRPLALPAPTLGGDANVRIMVSALERTFVRVTVDGEEAFSGRVTPGDSYPFEGEDQVEILTGNGAALRVTFNGDDLGLMGNLGEVVSVIYTAAGIATPTPTPIPTITPTPRVTITPTATSTATEEPSE